METVKIIVDWSEKNFCCAWEDPMDGVVVCTHKTLEGLKAEFETSLALHVEGLLADGESVPLWLQDQDYTIEWHLETAAILRDCERYTTLSAISHACGINQRQLSHYANGLKKARAEQREKIINGLHAIGQHFITVC